MTSRGEKFSCYSASLSAGYHLVFEAKQVFLIRELFALESPGVLKLNSYAGRTHAQQIDSAEADIGRLRARPPSFETQYRVEVAESLPSPDAHERPGMLERRLEDG